MNSNDHNTAIKEFFREQAEADPERYAEVCNKHPVLSSSQWRTVRDKEVSVGLLGLQPSRLSVDEARRYGLESSYDDWDSGE